MPSASLEQSRPPDVEALFGLEEPADIANADESHVPLRVDHEHPGRSNDEMVDVPSRTRHPAVVQDLNPLDGFEGLSQLPLTERAARPGPGRLRIVSESEDDAA
jgi:hypothetical protein